jgi:hypothetical protein
LQYRYSLAQSFDVDYPIECDDEYWDNDNSEQAFRQPPEKPSTITAFVWSLKLCQMLAFTCRTLYSTKKSKVLSGLTGNEWEGRIVNELATSMSKWKESLPYFCQSLFAHPSTCFLTDRNSALESGHSKRYLFPPICIFACDLLLYPNPNLPTLFNQKIRPFLPRPSNMYERREIVCGYA